MPLYAYDIVDRLGVKRGEPTECEGFAAARIVALNALGEMAARRLVSADTQDFTLLLRDEHGRAVYSATLSLDAAAIVSRYS